MFAGFCELSQTKRIYLQTKNASKVPTNAASLPTFRVYGASGLVHSGTAAFAKSGTVTGATNASPIVITSASHGLTTGTRITVADVLGNTAANGSFNVTNINATTFSLDGSTGNGAYTSGGTWQIAGLYALDIVASAGNGFESGQTYTVVVTFVISSVTYTEEFVFTVQ